MVACLRKRDNSHKPDLVGTLTLRPLAGRRDLATRVRAGVTLVAIKFQRASLLVRFYHKTASVCPKPARVSPPPLICGVLSTYPTNKATGVLVECDPSIKAIILKIDQEKHDYIVEDLDDQTLVIKESQLPRLKARLAEVGIMIPKRRSWHIQPCVLTSRGIRNLRIRSKCLRIVGRIEGGGWIVVMRNAFLWDLWGSGRRDEQDEAKQPLRDMAGLLSDGQYSRARHIRWMEFRHDT